MRAESPTSSASSRQVPLPRKARELGVHLNTIYRWKTVGVLAQDGTRHRLSVTRIGGRWFVSDDAWAAFSDALNATPEAPAHTPSRAKSARRAAAEQASRELDQILGTAK